MNTDATPGLDQQSTVRTIARVLAVVLLLVGVVLGFMGVSAFLAEASDPNPLAPSGFESVLMIGAGGFCIVFGLAAANVGWLRAQASYVAGETVPVVKDSLDHLRAGPYCRQCGTRNDTTAKFCDSCGQSLA
jgi:hypothetical protein